MTSKFLDKYFGSSKRGKNKPQQSETLHRLEVLTASLVAEYEPPDYTLMDIIIEMSDNGVIAFNHNGRVMYSNSFAAKITKIKDIKGKTIFEIIDKTSANDLREFMSSENPRTSIKVEVAENGLSEYYDTAVFKIANGKTFYIMFFINCLEKSVFSRQNCPLKKNCPFNQKCQIQTVEA